MGGLVAARTRVGVEYDVHGPLAASVAEVQELLCHTSCISSPGASHGLCGSLSCDECVEVGHVSVRQRCLLDYDQTMMQFGYLYAVEDLWSRDLAPSCLTGTEASCLFDYPGRLGAAALLIFSFLWPHAKLLILHVIFYAPIPSHRSRRIGYWLAALGKWTLLDVLLMSVIVSLDNVRLDTTLPAMWSEVPRGDFLQICMSLCQNSTSSRETTPAWTPASSCEHGCETAYALLLKALDSPALLSSSRVTISFPITVHRCMYCFCAAVALSVTCSVVVEILGKRTQAHAPAEPQTTTDVGDGRTELLSAVDAPAAVRQASRAMRRCSRRRLVHAMLLVMQTLTTYSALSLPLLRRGFHGPLAQLLEHFGARFGGDFSLLQLGIIASESGGMNGLLGIMLWIFVILCPLLRPMTQLVVLLSSKPRKLLHEVSRYISFYYALEVLIVVVPVVQVALQIMFLDLVSPHTFSPCAALVPPGSGGVCIGIDVRREVGYLAMVASVALHMITGFDGSPTDRYIHRTLCRRGGGES